MGSNPVRSFSWSRVSSLFSDPLACRPFSAHLLSLSQSILYSNSSTVCMDVSSRTFDIDLIRSAKRSGRLQYTLNFEFAGIPSSQTFSVFYTVEVHLSSPYLTTRNALRYLLSHSRSNILRDFPPSPDEQIELTVYHPVFFPTSLLRIRNESSENSDHLLCSSLRSFDLPDLDIEGSSFLLSLTFHR